MTRKLGLVARVVVMFAMGLAFVGASFAQTTTSATVNARKFEVISVDGDQLVVRDDKGTSTITVPDGFRFTVDGKALAVGDLKPGMKGTAVVTTTTAPGHAGRHHRNQGRRAERRAGLTDRERRSRRRPQALHAVAVERSRHQDPQQGREGDPRQRCEGGRRDHGDDRHPRSAGGGDGAGSAGNAGSAAPATAATPAPAKTEPAAPAPAMAAAPAASAEPAAPAMAAAPAASAEPPPAAPPPAMATTAASAPAESGGLGTTGWVLIILLIAVALYFFSRRKKPQ